MILAPKTELVPEPPVKHINQPHFIYIILLLYWKVLLTSGLLMAGLELQTPKVWSPHRNNILTMVESNLLFMFRHIRNTTYWAKATMYIKNILLIRWTWDMSYNRLDKR